MTATMLAWTGTDCHPPASQLLTDRATDQWVAHGTRTVTRERLLEVALERAQWLGTRLVVARRLEAVEIEPRHSRLGIGLRQHRELRIAFGHEQRFDAIETCHAFGGVCGAERAVELAVDEVLEHPLRRVDCADECISATLTHELVGIHP